MGFHGDPETVMTDSVRMSTVHSVYRQDDSIIERVRKAELEYVNETASFSVFFSNSFFQILQSFCRHNHKIDGRPN